MEFLFLRLLDNVSREPIDQTGRREVICGVLGQVCTLYLRGHLKCTRTFVITTVAGSFLLLHNSCMIACFCWH